MSPLVEEVLEEIRGAWRHKWAAMAVVTFLALSGWAIVFALPDRYEAGARVFVDTRTALKPVLQGLTVEQDVNAQLNYVRQSLLAGAQLQKIAVDSGVLPVSVTDPRELSQILNILAERIKITVRSASDREDERNNAGTIYGINYQDRNRASALRVVQTLLNTFVEETLGQKREGSEKAQKFLEDQIHEYEKRLAVAEEKLAEFKKRNIGLMPTDQGGYFAELQSELDAVKKSQTALSIATARRGELQKQLRGEAAVTTSGTPVLAANGTASGGDTLSRIKETQARLDDLLLKYTDKHPEVVATRETLGELKKRRADEIENLRRGDPNAVVSSGASSNPVYQSVQLAVNQVDVEIAALRGEHEQHISKAAELKRRLDTAPQVEAEYAQLNRDYDVNKAEYTSLLANYQKARMGERADSAGSVRFEIVQPPAATFQPVWPRRRMLLTVVMLIALAAGGGLAYGLHVLHPVVGSAHGLAQFTGIPVIGSVGPAFPTRARTSHRIQVGLFAGAVACLAGALVLAFVLDHEGIRLSMGTIRNLVHL